MNFHLKPETKEAIIALSLSGICIVSFYLIISNLTVLSDVISTVIGVLAPFLYGIFLSFLLMPLRDIIEKKWLKNTKFKESTKHSLAVALCMIFLILYIIWIFTNKRIFCVFYLLSNIQYNFLNRFPMILTYLNSFIIF